MLDVVDATSHDQIAANLSRAEQTEAWYFRTGIGRHQFVLAHALVRLALSHYFPVPPGEWRFDRDDNGRPFIVAPRLSTPVQFSLSHSRGLAVCLISSVAEAAVDVEEVLHSDDLELVARRSFSASELESLKVLSGMDWMERFFDCWTLKEAYTKARGLGLNLSLSDISFEFGPNRGIRAHFGGEVSDDPATWMFWRLKVLPRYTISVAARIAYAGDCEIIHRHVAFDGTRMFRKPARGLV